MRQPYVVPRRRLLFAVWLTVLALPILVLDNIPRTEAHAASVKTEAATVLTAPPSAPSTLAPAVTGAVPPSTEAATATTATTATTTKTTTPASQRPSEAKPAEPRTTAPPTTAAPANEETGGASWYAYNTGECAHRTIPKGTVVTVTRIDTGVSVTCVVTDRGPFGSGRIIDLDRTTFARLASPEAGVIQVRLTW